MGLSIGDRGVEEYFGQIEDSEDLVWAIYQAAVDAMQARQGRLATGGPVGVPDPAPLPGRRPGQPAPGPARPPRQRPARPAPEVEEAPKEKTRGESSAQVSDNGRHDPAPLPAKDRPELPDASRPIRSQEVTAAAREGIVSRVQQRIGAQADKFQLTYTEAELQAILKEGRGLGLSDQLIEDMIFAGSRRMKAISAADLMTQMENWANVSRRGFPYGFADVAEFQQFSRDLLAAVKGAGLPTSDVRVQGSALRKPTADDVDLAVFVDEATFDKLLVDRFDNRAAFSEASPTTPKAKLSLKGKSHPELVDLADDISAHETHYNSQAETFANAMRTGIINSKSDIFVPLKAAKNKVAGKYPHLNIQSISVLTKGGTFDVRPDLPLTSK